MMLRWSAAFHPLFDAIRAKPLWSALSLALFCAAMALLRVDQDLQQSLHSLQGLSGIDVITELVLPFGRGEVAVLIALAIAAGGRRRLGLQLLIALVVVAILTWMFKIGVGRERPSGNPFSFVSGDTSTMWALLPLLARSWRSSVLLMTLGIAVAASRVITNYHWPADVVAGAAVGLCAGVVAFRVCPDRLWPWIARRSTWAYLAACCWIGCVMWAGFDTRVGWLRTFLMVWSPALLAWALWPQLRVGIVRRRQGFSWSLWLVPTCLAVLLGGLACSTTLMDRDEPRNSLAAREMVIGGDYLVPTFNGEPRLHKPILPYWLMTLALHTGINPDVACRLPAVICMALAVFFTALSARRLALGLGVDPQTLGICTSLILASSPLVIICGSAATTDAVLLLGIAVSMWVLITAWIDGCRWWHALVLGTAIAWALLAKGPMALLVPITSVGGVLLWYACSKTPTDDQPRPRVGVVILLGVGVLLGLLLALAWFIPANAATHGELWRFMIGDQLGKRIVEARESHGGGWLYYLPIVVLACLAWLPALAVAFRSAVELRPPWSSRLLLAWAIPIFAAVTLVQTKLPHYLLPMLAPLAILLAITVVRSNPHPTWWIAGWQIQRWILLVLVSALVVVVPIAVLLQDAGLLAFFLAALTHRTSVLLPPLAPLIPLCLAIGLALSALVWLGAKVVRANQRL
ncbi:MAG: glycosyltransferase family 39 protein, partial [Planctomycetota bacterium]